MTQEDKELLFKDLCARLPYGVKVKTNNINILKLGSHTRVGEYVTDVIEPCKPYLFPLSSMTEEQYNEFFSYYHNIEMDAVKASGDYLKAAYIRDDAKYSWLNKNHFDYRGLIEKSLALDATNLGIYE